MSLRACNPHPWPNARTPFVFAVSTRYPLLEVMERLI